MIVTRHHWFRSGAYTLLGHIDAPETQSGLGVLIVPPFAWEDVCSYRPLRFMGRTLAENGMAVLRFDLPGMGDSTGDALDSGLLDAWIQSVDDAAAELRAATGVKDIAVVGIRLGAMLALTATARGANIQDLVLWGPSATGRAMLREMRAFGSMERLDFANRDAAAGQEIQGFEIGGFLIAPETYRALEALDLSTLPALGGRRIFLLSRDNLPHDVKLMQALKSSGATVEVAIGAGYAEMMALVDEAIPPRATSLAIAEFLTKNRPHNGEAARAQEIGSSSLKENHPVKTVIDVAGAGVSETVYKIKHSSNVIFGILSEPEPNVRPTESCIVFLNPGPVRHTGPNRMWVEAARRWAARGVPSLRLDLLGTGESDGEPTLATEQLYSAQMVEQVAAAMDSLRSRLGVRQFAMAGLCSGAFLAFQTVIRTPDIRTAILLNPRLFFWDPQVDRDRLVQRTVRGLGKWQDWRRLVRGQIPLQSVKSAVRTTFGRIRPAAGSQRRRIPAGVLADAWASIERNQSRVTLVFAENEPLLEEMEKEEQMPPNSCSQVRCVRVANCDHNFRPLWAQRLIHELMDGELDGMLQGIPVGTTDGAREKDWAAEQT
ncbi:MAG TPA: alpha/beta fold hydrolase [Bryobacteraceae bacterium]|nr:alpha/beta fold hydrolase [Bryobacteraceae bacterium]